MKTKNMQGKTIKIITILFFSVVVIFTIISAIYKSYHAPRVGVFIPNPEERAELSTPFHFTGEFTYTNQYLQKADEDYIITEVLVSKGEKVTEGQLIAKGKLLIDDTVEIEVHADTGGYLIHQYLNNGMAAYADKTIFEITTAFSKPSVIWDITPEVLGQLDDKCTVEFSMRNQSNKITITGKGTIDEVIATENTVKAISYIQDSVEPLHTGSAGDVTVFLSTKYVGTLIPLSAVVEYNGKTGVFYVKEEKSAFGIKNVAEFSICHFVDQNDTHALTQDLYVPDGMQIIVSTDKPLVNGIEVKY